MRRERTLGVVRVLQVILVLALLVGVVWIGQGVGLIHGSFMTGRVEWALIGGVLDLVAVVALSLTLRPHDS